jgi:hypothetical protein
MVEPSLRVVLASLVLAGLLMALVAVACAQDVAYYRAHGGCAYQLRPGRQGGWYAPRREAHYCGCPGEARDAD